MTEITPPAPDTTCRHQRAERPIALQNDRSKGDLKPYVLYADGCWEPFSRDSSPMFSGYSYIDMPEHDFDFVITKTRSSLSIRCYDLVMHDELWSLVHAIPLSSGIQKTFAIDGYLLLQHRPILLAKMRIVRVCPQLQILIRDVLGDVDLFENCDLHTRFKENSLWLEDWSGYQNQKANRLISDIEQVCLLAQLEEEVYRNSSGSNFTPQSVNFPTTTGHERSRALGSSGSKQVQHSSASDIAGERANEFHSRGHEDEHAIQDTRIAAESQMRLKIAAFEGNEQEVRSLLDFGVLSWCPALSPNVTPAICDSILGGHPAITALLSRNGFYATKNYLLGVPMQDQSIVAKALLSSGFPREMIIEQALNLPRQDDYLLAIILENDSIPHTSPWSSRTSVEIRCRAQRQQGLNWKLQQTIHQTGAATHGHRRHMIRFADDNLKFFTDEQMEKVHEILDEGADPSSGLLEAMRLLDIRLINDLLQRGADPRYLNDPITEIFGRENLMMMATRSTLLEAKHVVSLLLKHCGDETPFPSFPSLTVQLPTVSGLIAICQSGRLSIYSQPRLSVQDLTSARSSLIRDSDRIMSDAIERNDTLKVRDILERNSRLTGFNTTVRSIDLPREHNHLMEAVRLERLSIVRLLVQHSADVNESFQKESSLSVAAMMGSESMVRLLLRYGADFQSAFCLLRSGTEEEARAASTLSVMAKRFWDDHTSDYTPKMQDDLRKVRLG